MTATGTALTLCRNETLIDTKAATTTFEINSLGRAHASCDLTGDLDDVGIWSEVLPFEQVKAMYELASESELNYDLGQVQQLFDEFDLSTPEVEIDGTIWRLVSDGSIGGDPGDLDDNGGEYFDLNLGGGNGYSTFVHVPEPSSFLLLGLGALGLVRRTRRRQRRRA